MTLSPVFRSHEAVRCLTDAGVWSHLESAARGQASAISTVKRDLPKVLDPAFIDVEAQVAAEGDDAGMGFVQEYFFLILFRSVLETIGVSARDLIFCSELNFCIKGTITAADNLFDDQDKSLLPLNSGEGPRFRSILQLLAFEKLITRTLDRGVDAGCVRAQSVSLLQRELLSRMAAIGSLEGSEEHGINRVLEPSVMIDRVHRVRGGALFELSFVGPRLLERAIEPELLSRAERATARLGTAFQIVDDLTDFESDFERGSHNILVSQITHCGSGEERASLRAIAQGHRSDGDQVVESFSESAKAVIAMGEHEARTALEDLRSIGFWFPPELTHELVRAIVGVDGIHRMRTLS